MWHHLRTSPQPLFVHILQRAGRSFGVAHSPGDHAGQPRKRLWWSNKHQIVILHTCTTASATRSRVPATPVIRDGQFGGTYHKSHACTSGSRQCLLSVRLLWRYALAPGLGGTCPLGRARVCTHREQMSPLVFSQSSAGPTSTTYWLQGFRCEPRTFLLVDQCLCQGEPKTCCSSFDKTLWFSLYMTKLANSDISSLLNWCCDNLPLVYKSNYRTRGTIISSTNKEPYFSNSDSRILSVQVCTFKILI